MGYFDYRLKAIYRPILVNKNGFYLRLVRVTEYLLYFPPTMNSPNFSFKPISEDACYHHQPSPTLCVAMHIDHDDNKTLSQ